MRHILSVTIQALTPRLLTLKSNQGTKFGALKMPMFSQFDADHFLIQWENEKNIFRARLPVSLPRIIAPFLGKKKIAPGYYSKKYGKSR